MGNVYVVNEVVGSSTESLDSAIRQAIATTGQTVRNLEWFTVEEIRGHIVDGAKVGHFQVTLKLGFRYDKPGN